MDDSTLSCPLCCGKTFNSKETLVEHLSCYTTNFGCSICNYKFSSISLLIEHLSNTNCKPHKVISAEKALLEHDLLHQYSEGSQQYETKVENVSIENNDKDNDEFHDDKSAEDHDMSELPEESLDAHKMYDELLMQKSLEKPCYPGSDLQLLEENGHSRYTIVEHDGAPAIMSNGNIITKQNSDGTISITTIKEIEDINMKLEAEPVITVKDSESDDKEEMFSCNTCGVSFSSVIDHIQNYHKDQDVVVEMNEGQVSEDDTTSTLEFYHENSIEKVDPPVTVPIELVAIKEDAQESGGTQDSAPRRVITDTGDIVETSKDSPNEPIAIDENLTKDIPLSSLEMEVVDKKGRVFTRRYVQIDKFTSETDTAKVTQKTPYHQVVMKEIVTMDGGEKMKVYNCIVCHIYVTELEEFKSHPCTALKYSCPHCPVSYENAKSLCAHMKVHKLPKQSPVPKQPKTVTEPETVNGMFKCEICSTEFQSNKSLKLHKRMHDPVKSRPIDPPVEENNEISRDNCGKYCCLVCNKWIPVGYRIIHSNFHKTKENFNCDICNKKFSSHNYLAMHMNVHNVEKAPLKKSDKSLPYNCSYCDRQFARPHEKVKHERIHTGEKPHICDICGKSFRVSYCLTLHMRTHTGARPYACQYCGKRFKAHSVYNHHLLTHSDVRAYKCPFCPKAFKTSVQLAGHKNSHTKPFSCTQCNRPFASLYAVRVHTETHRRQNNLKFCCSLCGASYARCFALKDHMKQVHQQELETQDAFVDTAVISIEPEPVVA